MRTGRPLRTALGAELAFNDAQSYGGRWTLHILLQHLQSDPGSVTERSAKDLILNSLRLLGHGVASINKQRRQEIVKSCNITDVTQPAKHFVLIQTYLFGESKASELNFVGDLAEKVCEAV